MDLDLVSIVLEVWSRYPKQIMLIVEISEKPKSSTKRRDGMKKKLCLLWKLSEKPKISTKRSEAVEKSHV